MDIICSALPYYYSSLALRGDVLSCGCFPPSAFEGGPNNTVWETAASVPSAKNAAGHRGKLDFIPKMYLLLRQGRAFPALWPCLCWKGIHGRFSLQRQGKAVVYNQENFLALQPDTSPIGKNSQKWVSFGTLLKHAQESLWGSRTRLGRRMGTEGGGNGEEGAAIPDCWGTPGHKLLQNETSWSSGDTELSLNCPGITPRSDLKDKCNRKIHTKIPHGFTLEMWWIFIPDLKTEAAPSPELLLSHNLLASLWGFDWTFLQSPHHPIHLF